MVSFFAFNMFEFVALNKMFAKAKSLDEGKAWVFAIDDGVQKKVIELNTEVQLGDDGIDSLGDSLGEYAPFTVNERSSLGLQTGHIDFKVTGDYWRSWRVNVTSNAIIITVDSSRFDELVNELSFAPEHVGLTETSLEVIRKMVLPKYQEYARRELFS